MNFNGTSYVRYTLVNLIDRRLSLSLTIRTTTDKGMLMYSTGRVDYSILEVQNIEASKSNCESLSVVT